MNPLPWTERRTGQESEPKDKCLEEDKALFIYVEKDKGKKLTQFLVDPVNLRELKLPGAENNGSDSWSISKDGFGNLILKSNKTGVPNRDPTVVLAGRKAKDIDSTRLQQVRQQKD